ncbi:MAG: hypothetical protein ACC655_02660 [Rhodothermia bacterium]
MNPFKNRFPHDPDRHKVWEILVGRDVKAFVLLPGLMVEMEMWAVKGMWAVKIMWAVRR